VVKPEKGETMKFLQIINIETAQCVKELEVTGKTDREIERIERGILINMNTDLFFTDIVERT
jgi:hypothetical protein